MLIGIDGNEANIVDRVGVNKYAYELLWSIYNLQKKREIKHGVIVYLKNRPLSDLPKQSKKWEYKVIPGGNIWILTKLMPHLFFSSIKPDVFFAPSHYLPPILPMPKVCSIMDLGYLENSEQFKKGVYWQLKYWTAMSVFVSKKIITISNATKADIVRHYKFASKKIAVTHLGYDNKVFNPNIKDEDVRRVKNRHSIVSDYVLYLGTLKTSKNLEGLLEAYSMLLSNKSGIKVPILVIAGKKGWMYESIFKKVNEKALGKYVIFTDFIPERDKPALLKGAKVFVSPSYWEGFGLHVLEAMACGTPVVVSNVGSLPEIIEKAGQMVDPNNSKDIASSILKILRMSKNEYNMLVNKGVKQADKYSWIKTGRETIKILEGVIGNN